MRGVKVACFLLQKGLFIVGKLPLYAAHSTGNLHMGSADKLQAPAKRLPLQRELSAFRLTEDTLSSWGSTQSHSSPHTPSLLRRTPIDDQQQHQQRNKHQRAQRVQ